MEAIGWLLVVGGIGLIFIIWHNGNPWNTLQSLFAPVTKTVNLTTKPKHA